MPTLKFLGRGSSFNTKEGNTSSYIKVDDNLLLIDCGENIFERIREFDLLNDIKNIYILITHLHPDHAASLGSLIFYCHYIKRIRANVIYEDICTLKNLLEIQGVAPDFYTITPCSKTKGLNKLNIVMIKSYNMKHFEGMNNFGYEIEFENRKRIFYTGDTNTLQEHIVESLRNNNYQELYTDTCQADYDRNPHLSLRKLCEIIPRELRFKVYCMHYDCDELIEGIKLEGFNIIENITL